MLLLKADMRSLWAVLWLYSGQSRGPTPFERAGFRVVNFPRTSSCLCSTQKNQRSLPSLSKEFSALSKESCWKNWNPFRTVQFRQACDHEEGMINLNILDVGITITSRAVFVACIMPLIENLKRAPLGRAGQHPAALNSHSNESSSKPERLIFNSSDSTPSQANRPRTCCRDNFTSYTIFLLRRPLEII